MLFKGLNDAQINESQHATKKCEKENPDVDTKEIDKLLHKSDDISKEKSDDAFKRYMVCIHKEMKWLKPDGTYDTDRLKKWIKMGGQSDEEADEIIKECIVYKGSEIETVWGVSQCLYKHNA